MQKTQVETNVCMYYLGAKVQEGKGSTAFIGISKKNLTPAPKVNISAVLNEAHPYIVRYSRLTT